MHRRGFLQSAVALGLHGAMATQPVLAAQSRLRIERRTIDVDGRSASKYAILGQGDSSGLVLDPGERSWLNSRTTPMNRRSFTGTV
jgi:hypothetical protein